MPACSAVVLWPMCCNIEMLCCRHRTWHPTPSQYTDTGPTCRCAIRWCGTSHWNTQLPILMSCLSWKSFPDLPHTTANAQLDAVMVVNSWKFSRKYYTNQVLNPGPVVCESITLSARPQRHPWQGYNPVSWSICCLSQTNAVTQRYHIFYFRWIGVI